MDCQIHSLCNTSQAHRSGTQVRHTGQAHRSCTQVRHTGQAHRSGTQVRHTGQAHRSGTQVRCTSQAHKSGAQVRRTRSGVVRGRMGTTFPQKKLSGNCSHKRIFERYLFITAISINLPISTVTIIISYNISFTSHHVKTEL